MPDPATCKALQARNASRTARRNTTTGSRLPTAATALVTIRPTLGLLVAGLAAVVTHLTRRRHSLVALVAVCPALRLAMAWLAAVVAQLARRQHRLVALVTLVGVALRLPMARLATAIAHLAHRCRALVALVGVARGLAMARLPTGVAYLTHRRRVLTGPRMALRLPVARFTCTFKVDG
jgi:hypothetical protein